MSESQQSTNPFALHQTVYARRDVPLWAHQVLSAGAAVTVDIYGRDTEGPWFGSEAHRGVRFDVKDFTAVKPLPPLTEDVGEDVPADVAGGAAP